MNLKNIPITPGIYQFFNEKGELLYIGKAINLKNRVSSYFQKGILSPKTRQLVSQITSIKTIKTESEFDALLLEARLINKHQPKYNVTWRDDKHPLYIKITTEEFPKIRTIRREDDKKSIYFGPFPSSGIVRQTLRFLREIFPYCSENRIGTRPCFYSHIGLCNPCPNAITKLEVGKQKIEAAKYKHNISMIKRLLDGKSSSVTKQLERNMNIAAKQELFEKAAQIKRQLEKLAYLRQNRKPVKEYMQNPNLYDDVREQEQNELAKLLNISSISRIEGFDISNTQGQSATGSMVTFIDGEPEKNYYRRFKIRTKDSPDDTYMMYEVLVRRLKHDDWGFPDLIMVDGGKGQLHAALMAMKEQNISIPVIGLAKRLEEIIVPAGQSFKILRLPPSAGALRLLQRIRDESHRFANAYHRKLRSKRMV